MSGQNSDKLKAVMHLIIWLCRERPEQLGATKLYKAVLFSDIYYFRKTGKSITGATYSKQQYGPIPYRGLQVLDKLEEEGAIRIEEPAVELQPRMFYATTAPEKTGLADEEIQLIEKVVHAVRPKSAADVSELSHDMVWKIAAMDDIIPIEAMALAKQRKKPSAEALKWANAVAESIVQNVLANQSSYPR